MKLSDLSADMEYADRISIGANKPPAPTPYEIAKQKIDDLHLEAENFLDGETIVTAEMAEAVKMLKTDLMSAIKEADSARTEEYKPLNEKKTEIQQRYDPLIGGSKCDGGIGGEALIACQKALTPWLVEQQRIKDQAASEALAEAARVQAAALAAAQSAPTSLADIKAAGEILKQASVAVKAATKAAKVATTKTGLRVTFSAEISDLQELSRHVWTHDPEGMRSMMQAWADRTVSSFGLNAEGMKIPGVLIVKTETAR